MYVAPVYLTPDSPGAFTDYPLRENAHPEITPHVCPECKGHGGWNSLLNQYDLHGKPDTPHNRHLFSHFRSSCGTCYGWGYVTEELKDHVHKWVKVGNVGKCLNRHQCVNGCGRVEDWDSSD